jgi:hypothetical protein
MYGGNVMGKKMVPFWLWAACLASTFVSAVIIALILGMGAEAILNLTVFGIVLFALWFINLDIGSRLYYKFKNGDNKVINIRWIVTDATGISSVIFLMAAQASKTSGMLVLWLVLTAFAVAGFVVLRLYWYTPSTLSAAEKETYRLEKHVAKYSTMTKAEIKADLKSFLIFAFKKDKVSEGLDFTRKLDTEARTSDELDASTDASVKTLTTTVDTLIDNYAAQFYAMFHTA